MRVAAAIAVVAGVGAIACNRSRTAERGEHSTSARIGNSPLSHIGVVVRDIEAGTRAWADVLGISATPVKDVALQLPDGSTTDVKVASFVLPNSEIELMQPTEDRGPIREHLDKFGHGVYSIGFQVTDSVDELREGLQARGGTWTGGARGGEYALVDFRERFGATIRVSRQAPARAPSTQTTSGDALGNAGASHVGFAVRSYNEAATALSEILEVPPLKPMMQQTLFPEGHPWNPKAQVNLAMWRVTKNMGIELIEPVGSPSPWANLLESQHGNAPQHIGFDYTERPKVDEWVAKLKAKGGKWTVGAPKHFYAYMDFHDSLGVTIAITALSMNRDRAPEAVTSRR